MGLRGWLKHGLRHSLAKLLRYAGLTSDPCIAVDGGNGFGAQKLLRSSIPAGSHAQGQVSDGVLEDVQIITRFCSIEAPYWSCFLQHYASLGASLVHVCVQSDAELFQLEKSFCPQGLICRVHRLMADCTPAQALKTLDLKAISSAASFTLLADADEYLSPLRNDLNIKQLFALFPETAQFYLPWLMAPFVDINCPRRYGFWGHIGKPVIRSERMAAISFDHGFSVDHSDTNHRSHSLPVGLFGLAITHYWSRGFRDCLLKTFFNKFTDAKSADSHEALILIRRGELPVRLRLLAFLMLQDDYVPVPEWQEDVTNRGLEEALVRQFLSLEQEQHCRRRFNRYQELLRDRLDHMPLYPATSLLTMAKLLPTLFELESGFHGQSGN